MAKPRGTSPFPWIVFLLLIVSIVVFWILPNQQPPAEIHLNYRHPENTAANNGL